VIASTPSWGEVTIVATVIFACVLIAARIVLERRRGTLRVEREIPGLLGLLTGVALVAVVTLGVTPYGRLLVPVYFFLAGIVLLVLPTQRPYRRINTRFIGWLAILVAAIALLSVIFVLR
jgi:hypothetical protein